MSKTYYDIKVKIKNRVKNIPVLGKILFWLYSWFKIPIRLEHFANSLEHMKNSTSCISRHCCYLGDNIAITRVRDFKMLVNTKDMGITPHLIMDGFWEMHITSLFERVIQEGFTVIDIGANMGYYTLVAAQRVGKTGRVYAFEPEPNNYDILCKNIAINGFRPIVTACQKALLDKQGEVNFTVYEESPGGSSVFMSNSTFVNRPARKKTISVQTTTLDTFLADNLKVDIMKIDAEGAEPLIFKGMKNIIKNSPTLKIIMEFAPTHIEAAGENPRDFLWSLKNMGFKIKLVDRNSGQLSEVEIGSLLKCEIEDLFLDKVVV